MKPQLVYDLPTRLFHWMFAGFFLTAFAIAKIADSESQIFNLHSLIGLTLGFLLVLRIVWGFLGSQHARFSGFALAPRDLLGYFKGILSGDKKRWAGHNPASSWSALAMMTLGLGLALTGYLMTSGPNKETYEDFHAILSYLFLGVVAAHVSGIILHTIRFRDPIGLSMLHGRKKEVEPSDAISSPRTTFGLLLIGLIFAFGFYLFKNYDAQTRNLNFFGTTLNLGENEKEGQNAKGDEAISNSGNSTEKSNNTKGEHDDKE